MNRRSVFRQATAVLPLQMCIRDRDIQGQHECQCRHYDLEIFDYKIFHLLHNVCLLYTSYRYRFNISKVSGPGFDTEEEALKSKPENFQYRVIVWNESSVTDVMTD